jgi:CHASE2 domain-containing sensor protein
MFRILILLSCTVFITSCASKMNKHHPIVIVYVDEKTEKKLGDEFPISRGHYVRFVKAIQTYKPEAVILKVFFDSNKKGDTKFSELQAYNVFTQAAAIKDKTEFTGNISGSIANNEFGLAENKSVIYPNKNITNGMDGVGFVDAPTNKEGLPYSFYLLRSYKGKVYPSLPLVILEHVKKSKAILKQNSVVVDDVDVAYDKKGIMNFEYNKDRSLYKTYSFIDVLEKKLPVDTFNNSIVVVFYKGKKLPPIKAYNGESYSPAEIVSDSINNILKVK